MPAGLQFVLILPDGSKSLIPADWTDFKNPARRIADSSAGRLARMTSCVFAVLPMLSCAAPPTCQ